MLRLALESIHRCLEQDSIPHALIGGFALAVLGIHRSTQDVDFLVDESHKEKLKASLAKDGWRVIQETDEVLHFEGKGRADFLLARRPMSRKMLASAKTYPAAANIKCVSPEGIIGLKMQAFSNDKDREFQDKADILSLIKKYNNLNWAEIKEYAELFGAWEWIKTLKT